MVNLDADAAANRAFMNAIVHDADAWREKFLEWLKLQQEKK
jgi:hypothetical protein